ncbi:NUDIX hydrolase [Paenibacillus yanchengensis]|uniref:NUDIX hydrolase n=1 Tax=Paenibacillus yanchengensis TaxID=2035833 RepID=A0ABW4YM11_9BACL
MTTTLVNWGGGTVQLSWQSSSQLPTASLITSVHSYCFWDNKLLLVDLLDRGWDIPGGHIEQGETTEQCCKREVFEEGYVQGDVTLLGYVTVDHHLNDRWTESSPYPKIGYQVFYKMDITEILPFAAQFEAAQRIFIQPEQLADYYKHITPVHEAILQEALTRSNPSFS